MLHLRVDDALLGLRLGEWKRNNTWLGSFRELARYVFLVVHVAMLINAQLDYLLAIRFVGDYEIRAEKLAREVWVEIDGFGIAVKNVVDILYLELWYVKRLRHFDLCFLGLLILVDIASTLHPTLSFLPIIGESVTFCNLLQFVQDVLKWISPGRWLTVFFVWFRLRRTAILSFCAGVYLRNILVELFYDGFELRLTILTLSIHILVQLLLQLVDGLDLAVKQI